MLKEELEERIKSNDLHHINLSNMDLSHRDLTYKDMSYSNLSESNLSHSNLSYTNMHETNLHHADLSHTYLYKTDLSYSKLVSCNLNFSNVSFCSFLFSDLSHATFFNTSLFCSDLSRSILSYASFLGARLERINLHKTNLFHVNLSYVNLHETNLYDADLSNILEGSVFFDSSLLKIKYKLVKASSGKTHAGIYLWRTKESTYFGKTEYTMGKHYTAHLFSYDVREACHPGIYGYLDREDAIKHSLQEKKDTIVKLYVRIQDIVPTLKDFDKKVRVVRCKRVYCVEEENIAEFLLERLGRSALDKLY